MILISIFVSLIPLAWSKSCANHCGTDTAYSIVHDISCQCDFFCEQIGDCCEDYVSECAEFLRRKRHPTISCQLFQYKEGPPDNWGPDPLPPESRYGLYMVTSCSAKYENSPIAATKIIKKCAAGSHTPKKEISSNDLHLVTPVVIEGVTFVNIFCAICNAVDIGHALHWNLLSQSFSKLKRPNETIELPSQLKSELLYRFPPQNHSGLHAVHGESRLSKFCFKEVGVTCSTKTCTPYVCEDGRSNCYECSDYSTPSGCSTNFSGYQFLNAAKPRSRKLYFFYDLTIIFDGGNFIASAVNKAMGFTREIYRSNCSYEKIQSDEVCFPSTLDCLGVSCISVTEESSSRGTLILTLVGLCTSLISLILTLVICWKTESFQAKTVRLQIQCFIAHIAAILSFITAGTIRIRGSADWLCKSAAVFMQFSFLAMFSWINVIAWSMFMMIIGTKRFLDNLTVQSPKWVDSTIHYVLGWSSPGIIVLLSVLLEYSWSPGFMGYGKNGRCWINGQQGILYFFLVSLTTVLCQNCSYKWA